MLPGGNLLKENDVAVLREKLEGEGPRSILAWALDAYHPGIALATSFSGRGEDSVVVYDESGPTI